MRLLSIGTDRKLFEVGSDVRARQIECAKDWDEVYLLVFAKKSLNLKPVNISEKVFVHPTNSRHKLGYLFDAIKIGKNVPRPDLITAQDPFECGLVAWRLTKRFNANLELQIHTDFLSPYFSQDSLLNKLRVRLARFLLPKADNVRVVSQRIADSISLAGIKLKHKPVILPVKIDLEKIKNTPIKTDLRQKYPQFGKIVLLASRLTREKNIKLAIEATGLVIKKMTDVGLIIVGSGPEEKKLKDLVNKLKLEKNVIFEPWTDDLASYYKTANLFLNTSYYEGYGRTIVEALACNLPVISTDVGVAREVGAVVVNGKRYDTARTIMNIL